MPGHLKPRKAARRTAHPTPAHIRIIRSQFFPFDKTLFYRVAPHSDRAVRTRRPKTTVRRASRFAHLAGRFLLPASQAWGGFLPVAGPAPPPPPPPPK